MIGRRRIDQRRPPLSRMSALVLCALTAAACADDGRLVSAGPTSPPTTLTITQPPTSTSTSTTSTTTTTAPTTTSTTTSTSTSTTTTTSTTTSTSSSTSTTSTSTTTVAAEPPAPFACVPSGQRPSTWVVRPPSDIPPPELPSGWTTSVIGNSVLGADIEALVRPVSSRRRRVVVVGGIHGNEPASPPVVRGLVDAELAADVELWLVPVLNPDGSAEGLRCNANGVDLNRNFSWEWSPSDGGPAPLSEPETRAITALIDELRPDVVVWVHQPLGYVSSVATTSDTLEQAWATAAGMRVRADVTQHGGGESWTVMHAGIPAMLIEVDGWEATPEIVAAQLAGFEAMLAAMN